MNRSPLLPILLMLSFLLCAFFVIDRYLAMRNAETAFNDAVDDISQIQITIGKYPDVFGPKPKLASTPLKPLVQEASSHNGVTLAFLTETEKEIDEGVSERSVLYRANNVEQGKLVKFLCELEQRGEGARLKELRLKPSSERSGVFQEAEGVLSLRSLSKSSANSTGGDKHVRP